LATISLIDICRCRFDDQYYRLSKRRHNGKDASVNQIEPHTIVDLFFQLNWCSHGVAHTDSYSARQVNLWRDILPCGLKDRLLGKRSGDSVSLGMSTSGRCASEMRSNLIEIEQRQFAPIPDNSASLLPRLGRFYPRGVLKDVTGAFRADRTPFRVVDRNNGRVTIDMAHPLSGKPIDLSVTIGAIAAKPYERGGALNHWGEIITDGVGMQARWQDLLTHFFDDTPFARCDASPDHQFYAKPRLVQHLDDMAIDVVRQIYARFLRKGMRVLDLMSSWQSHLPDDFELRQLSGLGLNATELEKNPRLSDRIVHDLNQSPRLPYADASYDLVVCTVSVEYLVRPFEVLAEVARVLRPGGVFATVFSNRWFPTKAVRIWTELHEFERMGLVLEYFRNVHLFNDLHSYSVRGLARPADDKYIGQTPYSDPVYAVWGRRI
jgi:SAM-dependent methyltransferase